MITNNEAENDIEYSFNSCKICGGMIDVFRKNPDGVVLARCRNCSLEFVQSFPLSVSKLNSSEDTCEVVEGYYSNVAMVAPPKFQYSLDRIEKYFADKTARSILSTYSLLDVGCGNGEFLNMCRQRGFMVAGVESNLSCVKMCNDLGLNKIYADIDGLSERFDIITSFDVAEHLRDPMNDFIKLHEKLRPGGVIYIETPRRCLLDFYLYILGCFTPIRSNRVSRNHLQLYTDKALRILFKKANFKIVSFETRLSLSWKNKEKYLHNLGVYSPFWAACLAHLADFAISFGLFGRNKAVIMAIKDNS